MNPVAMFHLLFEGAQVFIENLSMISIMLVNILGLGVVLSGVISVRRSNQKPSPSGPVVWSIGVCGLALASSGIVAISKIWLAPLPVVSTILLSIASLALTAGFLVSIRRRKDILAPVHGFLVPVASLVLILLIRLAFLKELEYPLYSDSAIHYQIVENLQDQSESPQSDTTALNLTSQRYYHIGFHSIVVVLAAQLLDSFGDAELILITGQIFLIVFTLNLGLLASKIFKNPYAGIATMLFAGLGWTMPAHAINWGKYPAVSSMAVLPLAMFWMINSFNSTQQSRRFYMLLWGISSLSAVLLHSRSFIPLGCGLVTLASLSILWKPVSKNIINTLLWIGIGLLLALALIHPKLRSAFLPYLKGVDLLTTLWAIASLFIIARRNAKPAFGILMFILWIVIISMIPAPQILMRQAGRSLVDRPFLQLLLVSPLALAAGGAVSYAIRDLRSRIPRPRNRRPIASLGLLSLAFLMIMLRPVSDYKPNPCCIYMTMDDTFLIGWMETNISSDSKVLISTNPDLNSEFVKVATDAGAWITPLTKLKTIKFDYRTDFSNPALYDVLCEQNIGYIYVSLVNTSFSVLELQKSQLHYSPTFSLPDARLYSINCQTS